MEELKQHLEELEQTFRGKLNFLRGSKFFAIAVGLAGFIYASFEIISRYRDFKLEFSEFLAVETGLFLAILLPIVLTPLYLFLSDKVQANYCWKIKTSIFKSVLDKHGVEYNTLLTSRLPDSDIKNLNFENNFLTFAAGDDLIFGCTKDGTKFRIAEMHSSAFFIRKFDGLVGVRIYKDQSECESAYENFKLIAKEDITIRYVGNKIYFLKPGDKRHFEFQFKGTHLNKDKLLLDYTYFEDLAETMFGNKTF